MLSKSSDVHSIHVCASIEQRIIDIRCIRQLQSQVASLCPCGPQRTEFLFLYVDFKTHTAASELPEKCQTANLDECVVLCVRWTM